MKKQDAYDNWESSGPQIVKFLHANGETRYGYIHQKYSDFCVVVCNDSNFFSVPYDDLSLTK